MNIISLRSASRTAFRPLLLILLWLVTATAAWSQKVVYPDAEWQTAVHGLAPKVQRRVDEYVHALDTTGLMIVQHGRVVYQYGDVQALSYLASSRKSVLAMLYGPYVANGSIRLDRTIKDLGMSDLGGLLPIEERARVVDLISARSGVYHPASNDGDSLDAAPKRGSQEPGSYWLYSNWDFNAAGAAFERMTGKDIHDALRDDLAIPIGMQDFQRERQHKRGDLTRSQYPAYHMWLSTRDMARLGYLMLRHGRWRDRQLIPEDWVSHITSVVTPRTELHPAYLQGLPFGYGYMWWIWDSPAATGPFEGAYTAWGAYGQYITVLPQLDMVVAHKTVPINREVTIGDYLRLLDRLTGMAPASEKILPVLWEKGEDAAFVVGRRLQVQPKGRIVDESDLSAVGMALLHSGQTGRAEQVLKLNARLYPDYVRAFLALSRCQTAAGEISLARESIQKALTIQANYAPAKIQCARLGLPVEGHNPIKLSVDKLRPFLGVYRSKDTRYVVESQDGHLLIHAYQDGELNDEFQAFADAGRNFFVPADGTVIRFGIGANGLAETMDGTMGKETWHATRSP